MYKLLIIALFSGLAVADGYRQCEKWDSMCKNSAEIVATKCRIGVPVFHDQCDALKIPGFHNANHHSLSEGLPVTAAERSETTLDILRRDGHI